MQPPDLSDIPESLRAPIIACALGHTPPNVALMQLCIAATDAQSVTRAVNAVAHDELASLWARSPQAFALVKAVISTDTAAQSHAASPTACADTFDAAAALSPEASVALYSLGDATLLAAITSEIVQAMQSWGLLSNAPLALEIGCGNGRFLEALSPMTSRVVGLDISAAMVRNARERCRGLSNVEVYQTTGLDFAEHASASIDLVFAVDSFPYIVRCGPELALRHFIDAARVLRSGGHLLILNYSYRGERDRDRHDVAENARAAGLTLQRATSQDFRLWDGLTYRLQKTGRMTLAKPHRGREQKTQSPRSHTDF